MTQDKQTKAMQRFEAIVAESRSLKTESAAFFRIVKKLSTSDGFADLKSVGKALQKLGDVRLDAGDLAAHATSAAEDASAWLGEEWQRRSTRFADELTRYLTERTIRAVATGDRVEAPPFAVEIRGQQDKAQLTYAGEDVGKPVALSAPVIYRAYTETEKLLKRNETRPEQFATDLVEAYRSALLLREGRGPRIRLPEVHFALFILRQTPAVRSDPRAGKIKQYPRYQFAWDLGLLRESRNWCQRHHIVLHEANAASRARADSVRLVVGDGTDVVLGNMEVSGK